MDRLLSLAREIKTDSQELYNHFKAAGNRSRMAHMRVIFDAAEKVRYKLEVQPDLFIPEDTWKALLIIDQLGYPVEDHYDENEKLVLPLYEKFSKLEQAFLKRFGRRSAPR